jgi:hypothetical protein
MINIEVTKKQNNSNRDKKNVQSFSALPIYCGSSHFSPPVHFCGRNLGSFATRQLETGGQRGSQAYNLPSQHFESLIDVAAYAVCIDLFLEAEGQYSICRAASWERPSAVDF